MLALLLPKAAAIQVVLYCCCYTVAVFQVYVTQVAVIKSPFLRLDVMLQFIIVLRRYSVSRTLLTGQLVQEFIIIIIKLGSEALPAHA